MKIGSVRYIYSNDLIIIKNCEIPVIQYKLHVNEIDVTTTIYFKCILHVIFIM